MTDDGTLPDRLRNMVRNPNAIGTRSAACWQWHDDCALLLAADRVAERDADVSAGAVARTVAMSHIAAERDAERAARERAEAEARQLREAISDPDELRWHRWHCEETGQGDDLRELLVRIADAADAADAEAAAVAEGAEDRVELDAPPEPAPTPYLVGEEGLELRAHPDEHADDRCKRCGDHYANDLTGLCMDCELA